MSTNCVSPPALEDKQLLAYLDDRESNQEVARHLEKCSYCRERATALDRLQKRMTGRLYRVTCPSTEELGEYHLIELGVYPLHMVSASRRLVIAQHLRECPHCRGEVNELKEFFKELTPAATTGFSQKPALTPAFALRGEEKSTIHIENEGIHIIAVDIQSDPEGQIAIQCQVVDENSTNRLAGALVELNQAGASRLSTALDEYGQFIFEDARPGSFQFTIRLQSGKVVNFKSVNIVA